jgi:hypothetical protein
MSFRAHQLAELLGIVLMIGATVVQLFYLEPVKRAIEWRQVVFTQQENAHVLAETVFDNRIAILKAMKVAPADIETAEAERKKLMDRYETAHANVANIVLDKEPVEAILQWIVIAMFIIGTLLTTFGPIAELRAANRKH